MHIDPNIDSDFVISVLISIPIEAFISAFLLRLASKKFFKITLSYFEAYKIEFIIAAVFVAFLFIIIFIFSLVTPGDYRTVNLLLLVIYFFIGTPFYSKLLKYSDGLPIGFKKGLIFSLAFCLFKIIFFGFIGIAITLIVLLIMNIGLEGTVIKL